MTIRIQSDTPPLCESADGVVRVSGTRIPLERIVRAFCSGVTPEQIAQDFDVLTIESTYAVVNYYLHHRREVDAYLAAAEQETMEMKTRIEECADPVGIRARLIARRSTETS